MWYDSIYFIQGLLHFVVLCYEESKNIFKETKNHLKTLEFLPKYEIISKRAIVYLYLQYGIKERSYQLP